VKIGKWNIVAEQDLARDGWVARLEHDRGVIVERAAHRWEAIAECRDHYNALRIMGEVE
jgi:hypothetical protein